LLFFWKKRREITHGRSFASLEKRLYERVERKMRRGAKKEVGETKKKGFSEIFFE